MSVYTVNLLQNIFSFLYSIFFKFVYIFFPQRKVSRKSWRSDATEISLETGPLTSSTLTSENKSIGGTGERLQRSVPSERSRVVISISGYSFMESAGEMIDPGRHTTSMALERAALTVSVKYK